HPDDVERSRIAHSHVIDTGSLHIDLRLRCKGGEYRWFTWASTLSGEYAYSLAFEITEQKKTEEELVELAEQNQRIIRTIFDGYLLGAMDGHILDVNQTYCDMVGYSREELLQKTVYEMETNYNETDVIAFASNMTQSEVSVLVETQHYHKNGQLVDVEVNNIFWEDGRITCFIRDISERKRMERKIRRSEQRYRGLIESQIDFVCRYTPDTVLTYVNDAYCDFFGRSREELIGISYLTLAPEESKKDILARIHEVMENPAPDTRIFYFYDSGGNKYWVQWIDYGITNEAGEVVELQAVGRDITPMMEAQQQLAEREEMLTTILENIPLMVAQGDEKGRFNYVNKYWVEVLDWTLEEIHSLPNMMEIFYPDAAERERIIQSIIAGQEGWMDTKIRTRNGNLLDTSWANVQLSDGRKLGIGQVVTHRVELEKQRLYAQSLELELQKERELRALKERFVSLVAHEFRQPLAAMSTSLDFVLRYQDRITAERSNEKLLMVQKQIQRMAVLIEDALRFSKADAQKTEF
ncbi:MAG: PAS domain S-box protein, partial [Anaerolineae bacterium]|nr:PAS domain S-box protein [Anaerolineae bacterium]